MRRQPVTVALLAGTCALTLAHALGPTPARIVDALAQYRAADLANGRVWRLAASALLAEGWLQLLWTLLVGGLFFTAAERCLGSIQTLFIVVGAHVVPTLLIACWAEAGDPALLHVTDYGTSCLILGAAGALIGYRRLLLLIVGTAAALGVDITINSSATIAEHVLAILLGLTCGYLAAGRAAAGTARLSSFRGDTSASATATG